MNISLSLAEQEINWNAVAAVGTILSSLVALGIAVFSYIQSNKRDHKSHEKEAIEKIIVPIRKELDSFSLFKWDSWYFSSRWHNLKDKQLEFPLQFFWINEEIRKEIENFDQKFLRVGHLAQQRKLVLSELVAGVFKKFLSDKGISCLVTGNGKLEDENIIHSHWSAVVGGKHSSGVTLYNLVMWGKSVSEYLEERKQDSDLPNTEIEELKFSMHNPSANIDISFTVEQFNEMLLRIDDEIKKNDKLEDYRKQWRDLYCTGSELLKKIDVWLAIK